MKTLVLDFDGVIADSQMECLFVGFNTYLKFNKNTKLKHSKIVEEYKKLRPYVIDAFCYYVIFYIIENKIIIKDQNDYSNLRKGLAEGIYAAFVEMFYSERKRLISNNINEWLALIKPYGNIIPAIRMLSNNFHLAISTNNRKFTIDTFSKKHGIAPKIVIDSSFGSDKKVHIENIKNRLGVNFSDIYFVDDQIKNFDKLLPLRVNCYLATWGYNTQKQHEEAKKLGTVLLTQENFYETFAKVK